jgi:hypothetical protein
MMRGLLFFAFLTLPSAALACPACAGGDAGSKISQTPTTVIILGCFILLTYIPFYFLFRAAKKFDPKNGHENL